MNVLKVPLGPLKTNCYIVGDGHDCIVIDPADNAKFIVQTATDAGWTIREILATHGHFDHIMAVADLKALTGARFRCHALEAGMVRTMPDTVARLIGLKAPQPAEPDGFVEEGEQICVGEITLEVLFTPGHSAGHVSYVERAQKLLFDGDVLFMNTVGRTDLPGMSHAVLMESIMAKLMPLDDEVIVLPGHGHNTTIGDERRKNPYIQEYQKSR
ncbi:MAG TPA: MBL fold metallo-hydrolase [Aggregatilineaceae bacterium]|nr:MBL fold metallo-hydrolase [Aggregatilineaceae bacterium]